VDDPSRARWVKYPELNAVDYGHLRFAGFDAVALGWLFGATGIIWGFCISNGV